MKLRRKLLTIFGALAIMSLLSAGLTIWSTLEQHSQLQRLEAHYAQNILLQRIRTNTSTLYRRHAASILLDRPEMTEHFEDQDARVRRDLDAWEKQVIRESDRQRVSSVRGAYGALADQLAALMQPGLDLAELRSDGVPGQEDYQIFRQRIEESLEANQSARDWIHLRLARIQEAIQLAVAISAFGTLCLVLLLWAYVASDIFAPLNSLQEALNAVSRGDLQRRLDDERDDELGEVSRAFNRAIDGMARLALSVDPQARPGATGMVEPEIHDNLSRLETDLRETAKELMEASGTAVTAATGRALIARTEELCATVQRITTLYVPAPLDIAPVDVAALLYESVAELHRDLARRSVSVHVEATAGVPALLCDRARLRESLHGLLRDAVDAMPARGARLELKAGLAPDVDRIILEIIGTLPPTREVFGELPAAHGPSLWPTASLGIAVARRVVEQHGGTLTVHTTADGRRSLILSLPLNDLPEPLSSPPLEVETVKA